MVYPDSPFPEGFDKLLTSSKIENDQSYNSSSSSIDNTFSNFHNILKWLCTSPGVSSMRVNTLRGEIREVRDLLCNQLESKHDDFVSSNVYIHELMEDVIIVKNSSRKCREPNCVDKEVIVDSDCATAVLRGAHIFAPGVLGMSKGCQKGDTVSIYVDLDKKCKKGWSKHFNEPKVFIGNGTVKMTRSELYDDNLGPRGIAIEVTETISGCPQIRENWFERGTALLQNLPSIVCIYALDPSPNEVVLDMCAAPGHKTSHIAGLMKNQGTLVAIDKTPGKVKILREHCLTFNANVQIFHYDSRALFDETSKKCPNDGPPYPQETFDRILLDAPCSALGKRPQFRNNISEKVLNSYIPLQKKLFYNAVNLLKPNGTLVYSTCTITIAENEGLVEWALKKFENLRLIKAKLHLGGPGLAGTSLTKEDLELVQRFGPEGEIDSTGFFIACFTKS